MQLFLVVLCGGIVLTLYFHMLPFSPFCPVVKVKVNMLLDSVGPRRTLSANVDFRLSVMMLYTVTHFLDRVRAFGPLWTAVVVICSDKSVCLNHWTSGSAIVCSLINRQSVVQLGFAPCSCRSHWPRLLCFSKPPLTGRDSVWFVQPNLLSQSFSLHNRLAISWRPHAVQSLASRLPLSQTQILGNPRREGSDVHVYCVDEAD